ncbi:MAG: MurR/RpiR family transcriptional regulator [Pseudobutyrivibrio ruminis]|uniref:MurR/RpiR family transcriptional regulator n=1 Tax=Pseudobutyrivibrio ruminis TaxID=46206 RepID=A0A927UD90_9FIRM|nr:MurR/RpiR family transcriptional regulator [Pseudobutyrivibrio ruminis]
MATTTDLISKINEKYGRMSKGQKLLANYIIDNYDKAVFLTAAKLGEIIGVSESTVVRFASFIGYKGYPEFQEALEGLVRNKLNTSDRIEITNGGIEQNGVLRTVLSSDALKIKNTMESIDEAAFDNAVETILNARRIYVVGIRTCAPLASFLSFYLNMIFDNVVNLQTSSTSELFEQMIHITEEDCIIGISFPRYSMRTLKALEFANNRRANVITITDSIHSPMNLYSSCNLIAESDMHAAVDSLVAPLSVINAMIVALCNRRQAQVAKNLEMIEEVWNDYQFYENDEIDLVDDSLKMYYPGEN